MGRIAKLCRATGLAFLCVSMATAALADGAWIDALPGAWNTPGAAIPPAPAGNAEQLARCTEQVRPASTAADRALEAAGWKLFGPVLSHGSTSIVRAMSNADGMCRPLGYQAFVFVGDAFAGTLSPAPMDSRTDGALSDLVWLDGVERNGDVLALREAEDALCCPSRESAVVYAIEQRDGRPVLTALSAQTIALAPPPEPAEPPPPIWTGSLGAGLSLNTGNTDTSSYNLTFDAVRDPKKKWIFRTDGLYLRSEENEVDTADKSTLNVREERSLGDRLFVVRRRRLSARSLQGHRLPGDADAGRRLEGGPSRAGELELRRRRRRRVREEPRFRQHLERGLQPRRVAGVGDLGQGLADAEGGWAVELRRHRGCLLPRRDRPLDVDLRAQRAQGLVPGRLRQSADRPRAGRAGHGAAGHVGHEVQ